MTSIHDEPETFAATALAGFCSIHARTVRPVSGGVVRSTATPRGKVAVVVGGGSGHYPAFAGYVGPGLADAAVAGDVFASPSTRSIAHVVRLAHRGGGILLGFGNYAGDVLNFGLAAERLAAEGIEVRVLPVSDDVASAPVDQAKLRRGVAGDLVVFKIAGAAAEAGMNLADVERLALLANARTISFGVAFSGCTLPGAVEPLFTVPERRMAVGLGIHGEPGIAEEPILPASALAKLLVDRLLRERPNDGTSRVAVVLNGLGCSKHEELFVLWTGIEARLKMAGLEIVEPEIGEFVTSLDMAGCSLTMTWLDDELEELWRAPTDTPVLRRGAIIATEAAPALEGEERQKAKIPPASEASRVSGRCVATLMSRIAEALRKSEEELGRIDAVAGDGDHGQGMSRGCAAAAEAARKASAAGAGAATVLALAGDAWADRAGGTSGALWGLALRSWSGALGDDLAITPEAVAEGAAAAYQAVTRLGRARIGDKTLVDALDPFVKTLTTEVKEGQLLAMAWRTAAGAAKAAADATAQLTPRLGRARPLAARSLGHPDAGAVSLAICARVAGDFIASASRR